MSTQKTTIRYRVNSRLSKRKSANIVWEKTFYVRCCRQQLVNVLRVKEKKNSAWLKSSAQVKRFMVRILHQKSYGKTGYNRNVQLVLQHTMLQNEMKSDIARFNDHERNVATLYILLEDRFVRRW